MFGNLYLTSEQDVSKLKTSLLQVIVCEQTKLNNCLEIDNDE